MSKDIRSFFSPAGGSKKKDVKKSHVGENCSKKSKGTAKRLIVLSDSDDDDSIIPSSLTKRCKTTADKKPSKPEVKVMVPGAAPKREPKAVNPMDVFGQSKVKRSAETTSAAAAPSEEPAEAPKRKKKKGVAYDDAGWDESFSDLDFLSTLDQLDAIEAGATQAQATPPKAPRENGTSGLALAFEVPAVDRTQRLLGKAAKEECLAKPDDDVEEIESTPTKTKTKKECSEKTVGHVKETEYPPSKTKNKKEHFEKTAKEIESTPTKSKSKTECSEKPDNDVTEIESTPTKTKGKKEHSEKPTKEIESPPTKTKGKKEHSEKTAKEIKSTPTKSKTKKERSGDVQETEHPPTKTQNKKEHPEKPPKATEPTRAKSKKAPLDQEEDLPSWVNDPGERRRLSAIGYQRYLSREGPKNAGSKPLPPGSPSCLLGLTFVVTGVLDSLERDEASALITSYGGKVTASVSRKTSYLVAGDDAGPAKVAKAEACGAKRIDEDGLLDLIREKSGLPIAATEGGDGEVKVEAVFAVGVGDRLSLGKRKGLATTSEYFDTEGEEKSPRKAGDRLSPGKRKGLATTSEYFDTEGEEKSPRKAGDRLSLGKRKGESPKSSRDKAKGDERKAKSPGKIEAKSFYGETTVKNKKSDVSIKPEKGHVNSGKARSPSKAKSPGKIDAKSFYGKPRQEEDCRVKSAPSDVPQRVLPSNPKPAESLMWVDKYRPTSTNQIIGQQTPGSNVNRLKTWLQNWHKNQFGGKKLDRPNPWARGGDGAFFKAALLSGPPGVGKTTTAHLVCRELGLDAVELNASDARSQKRLHGEVGELLASKSLMGYFQGGKGQVTTANHVLIMDEVDGMAGNEDRGGVSELIALVKGSKVPVICLCNDRSAPKLRTFITHCFELPFQKPRLEQIRGAMMSICFKEGVKATPAALGDMISACGQDVRQVLHQLSMFATVGAADRAPGSETKQLKHVRLGPWDVVRKVFSSAEHRGMTMNDKSALFFFDIQASGLFVQENYLHVVPDSAKNNVYKQLDLIAEAADSICWGDVVEKIIRSRNDQWSLLPTQAMFSSVVPGDLLSGTITRQIAFPSWFGRNSSGLKHARLASELHAHTRLATSGSRLALTLDYLRPLRDALARPLKAGDAAAAVEVMRAYHLARTDLDGIMEMAAWKGEGNPMDGIDAKVKAAFTRLLNKEGAMLPYAQAEPIGKRSRAAAADDGADEEDEEDEGDKDDISRDAMIKAKKPAPAKKAAPAKKTRGKEPATGGSKAKGSRAKGKSK